MQSQPTAQAISNAVRIGKVMEMTEATSGQVRDAS
jgi:hypothetical protein